MIKKKYILGIMLALLMLCAAVTAADEVSAAKYKVDKGSVIYENGKAMMQWNTYLDTKTNKRTVDVTFGNYNKKNKKYIPMEGYTTTLKKVSKTKIKIVEVELKSEEKKVKYKKTRFTTKAYYWNVYRPQMIKHFKKTKP